MPKFRSSSGVWLNYEVAGVEEADVLILLHANPFDSRMWLYQVAHLSQYFRVIALDFSGYGKSSPIGDKAISISDMAKDQMVSIMRVSIHMVLTILIMKKA